MTDPLDATDPAGGPALPRWNLAVALGLFVGWIVLYVATPALELTPGVRAWYPPAALLAAACLVWGARALVPLILASLTLGIWIRSPGEPLWRYVAVSVLGKVLYWLGARVLRAARLDLRFTRPADVVRFGLTFTAVGAASALLGVGNARDFGALTDPDGLRMLRAFWIGDLAAVLALGPAILAGCLALAQPRRALRPRRLTPRELLQLIAIPASIALAALLSPGLGLFAYAVCLLPLGWIALEHGSRHAAGATALITFSAVVSLQSSAAPLTSLEVQAFMGLLAVTGLLIGSVADDRERAVALLHQSEERYRSLVELLPDPVVVHADGRILFANGAAANVFGAPSADALHGMHLAELADPVSRDVVRKRIDALAEGERVGMAQHTMRRLDGAVAVLESVSTPFTFHGRPAALTVARDVTRRVRLETELRHAQRMEAVGRLAGGIAHDFNNLLTVITSYSELIIADSRHPPELRTDVREILHAANRAAAMTRQLLSFSRRQLLAPAPLDVNEVVAGMETLLRRLIGPEIAILSRLDPSVGTVLADKGQLEQVIVNLAVNARDAMPHGGVLAIETANVDRADDPATARCTPAERYAAIIVRDTGGGIDPETLRRIFDPFFTTKEVGQGTGLGLATVHGIVEQSGGAVAVESHLGAGSAFRILLPVLSSIDEARATATATATTTATTTTTASTRIER